MNKNKLGNWGILFGGTALLLALVHFWAGPFSPQPSLESVVAEKAASIRQATLDALSGKAVEPTSSSVQWDADRIANTVTAVLGGLAFIFAAFSLGQRESLRVAGGAAALGVSAIAFQFIAMYAMAILAIILIAAVLSSLGASI